MEGFNNFKPVEQTEPTSQTEEDIKGNTLQIGSGKRGLKSDERGLWLGSEQSDESPFHIDMDGNIHVRSTPDGGGNLTFYDEKGVPRIFIGFEDEAANNKDT